MDQGFQSVVSISSESPSGNSSQTITPAFVQYIEELMRNNSIPGLALAVVDSTGKAELGAWGNRTEDGDPMTSDVSVPLLLIHGQILNSGEDIARPSVLFQGFLVCVHGYFDR